MAQQNVPTPAFTEFESSNKIPAIRSELKAMCAHCDDSSDVQVLHEAVEALDDEKLLECYKTFELFKNCRKLLSLFYKKLTDDTEKFNMICVALAVTLIVMKK